MSDGGEELVRMGMEVALKPVTDIASDVLGIAGGAWLHEVHGRIRDKLSRRTAEILKERDVQSPAEASPSILIPLLKEAQDENRDELLELWARLIAASMDANLVHLYRRQYVEIVKQLEPIDAVVLQQLAKPSGENTRNRIAGALNIPHEQVEVSFANLYKLALGEMPEKHTIQSGNWYITALGKEFLRVLGEPGNS